MKNFYHIPFEPIPWTAPKRNKNRYYNPRHAEKSNFISYLKSQKGNSSSFKGPLQVDVDFYLSYPKSYPQKKRKEVDWYPKKPDRSNLLKMIEDCLQDAGVIENDSRIVTGRTSKYVSTRPPHIIIFIQEIESLP